jgi:hypothetical protein
LLPKRRCRVNAEGNPINYQYSQSVRKNAGGNCGVVGRLLRTCANLGYCHVNDRDAGPAVHGRVQARAQ